MYAIVVVAMLLGLASALAAQCGHYLDLTRHYAASVRRSQQVQLAENLAQFRLEHGAYPVSPVALANTVGYEHVRSVLNPWQGYALSVTLADGVWRYQRMVTFTQDPSGGVTTSSYLAANACGTGSFAMADSWCGARNSTWFRQESREEYNDAVSNERARLRRTLQKLADAYSAQGSFPARDNAGVPLVAGNTYTLSALSGYAGTAATCREVYVWRGVPLGCEDLFDAWGREVGLAFTSAQSISLISETPIINAAGTPLVVAAGFTM